MSTKKMRIMMTVLMGLVLLSIAGCAKKGPAAQAGKEPAAQAGEGQVVEMTEEGSGSSVGVANPWRDCTEEEAAKYAPNGFSAPEGATDIMWSIMEVKDDKELPGTMVQLTFDYDGASFVAREQPVAGEEIVDISGMYYEWVATDEGTLQNWGGGNMPCRMSRYIGDEGYVDICLWFDIETGYAYSLSAMAEDLDGFDIQAVAEAIYDPAKQVGANMP